MSQSAADVPIHSLQRKAAIALGGVEDHAGAVTVTPIKNFDLSGTIFNTLQGALPRYVIRTRIAKHISWDDESTQSVESAYSECAARSPLPAVAPALLSFLSEECDFDVEHADGSFLDHLYFCYEYTHHHYAGQSALVMLLHSILGTGTNTFAMTADKIPALRSLLNDFEWRHVEAFPSVLRLLYAQSLRQELWRELDRLNHLEAVRFHRVIDNKEITLSGEDFWIQLNYQLIHLTDFIPVANWSTHANDTAFIVFRDLYTLLDQSNQLSAQLAYSPASGIRAPQGEEMGLGGKVISWLPVKASEQMAAKSVRRFSDEIGHSLNYELIWRD